MEPDQVSRGVEIVVSVLWIVMYFRRMRAIRLEQGAEGVVRRVQSAIRPIQHATWAVMAVSLPLWLETSWQPFGHALFAPSLVANGIALAIMRVGERGKVEGSVVSGGTA